MNNGKIWKTLATLATASLLFACSDSSSDPEEPKDNNTSAQSSSEIVSSTIEGSSTVVASSEGTKAFCDDKGSLNGTTLSGTYDADICLSADKEYSLDDVVYIGDGATISVEAGTMIKSGNQASLVVDRGGKIMAEGTADKPIVFTSSESSPMPSDWGGIVIYGKAPISTTSGTWNFEAIPTDEAGGSEKADNSGVLKFVRIEYAGNEVSKDNEFNGLTLAGVGSGTTLEYIQVDQGSDDGIEWFGGAASAKNIIASNGEDDGFDIDYGFQGTIENGLVVEKQATGGRDASDCGIEAGSKAENADQLTEVTFKNLTIITASKPSKKNAAIHIKDNVVLDVQNAVIVNPSETDTTNVVLRIDGEVSLTAAKDNKTKFTNVHYAGAFKDDFKIADIVDANDAVVTSGSDILDVFKAGFTKVDKVSDAIGSDLKSKISGAGAIQGTDWTAGWTKNGTLGL